VTTSEYDPEASYVSDDGADHADEQEGLCEPDQDEGDVWGRMEGGVGISPLSGGAEEGCFLVSLLRERAALSRELIRII
jgi:hypothetical protein